MERVLPYISMDDLLAVVRAEAIQANGIFGDSTVIKINNRGGNYQVEINRPKESNYAEV